MAVFYKRDRCKCELTETERKRLSLAYSDTKSYNYDTIHRNFDICRNCLNEYIKLTDDPTSQVVTAKYIAKHDELLAKAIGPLG